MTGEEIKEILAGVAVSQAKTERILERTAEDAARRQKEADLRQEEIDRRQKEADLRQEEVDRRQEEIDRRQEEIDRRQKELHRSQAETDRKLQDLADNIGGLNNKFGSFTEALAFPSLRKVLFEDLKMDVVDENVFRNQGRRNIQIDVLAFSNSRRNAVFVVEIKSRLQEEGISQLGRILERFPDFFPEHRDKELFGMLAVVECEADIRKRVLEEGIYLAEINDSVFELEVPKEFEPRSFSHPPKPAAAGAL